MIRIGTVIRATHEEVTTDRLEDLAATNGGSIEMPAGREGWAYLDLPGGRKFKAFVPAPEAVTS